MGGEVMMFGKPHAPIYDAALARIDELKRAPTPRRRVLAIGDGADTDLAAPARAGLDCLFITDGVHREELYRAGRGTRPPRARAVARARKSQTRGFGSRSCVVIRKREKAPVPIEPLR